MKQNGVIKLEEYLRAEARAEASPQALALGKFHPERIPSLGAIPTFTPENLAGPMTVSTAVSPDCSFRLLKEVIDSAGETLDIYIYNISADHIVDLLKSAAARGVHLRVMYDSSDDGDAETELLDGLANVTAKVAPMARPRSVFTVCHQKFVVADGKRVLMGSANWAGTSYPNATQEGQFKKGNREWIVAVENDEVAAWFAALFQTDWDIPEFDEPGHLLAEEAELALPEILVPAAAFHKPETIFPIKRFERAVRLTPLLSPDNYFDVVKAALEAAVTSIDVQQQSIKAGRRDDGSIDFSRRVNQLLAILQDKKASGVTVRIMVSPKFSWQESLDAARAFDLEENLRAISLDTFTHLHNKGIVIDAEKVVVTSTNWTDNSITRAREAGLFIEDAEVARYYQEAFDLDWEKLSFAPDELPHHLLAVMQDVLLNPGDVVAMRPGEFLA